MKKKMKQSTHLLVLNSISILALLFMAFCLFSYSGVNRKINKANSERFELTYNANRFMNGSSYLTNEVRAYAATGKQEHYDNYWNEVNNLKNRDIGVGNMKALGLTQEELAEKVGRAYKYCQDIERGSCGMSIETLILLSSSLNVTMDYIIYGYEDTEPKTPEQLLEMEAVEELLGHCSEKKRSYAMELLRLFLKACDEK